MTCHTIEMTVITDPYRAQSLELHMIYMIITASMSPESRWLTEYFSVVHKTNGSYVSALAVRLIEP